MSDVPSKAPIAAHRVLRRLAGRERLQALARAVTGRAENPEHQRLCAYLEDWSSHQLAVAYKPNQGFSHCTLAQYMKADSQSVTEHLAPSDAWAMQVIDASIDDLIALEDGAMMRSALRVRYLNEGLTREAGMRVRVFRSNRLVEISMEEADALADRGELALIPIVKKKGLPL
jgi:hypothetical protein